MKHLKFFEAFKDFEDVLDDTFSDNLNTYWNSLLNKLKQQTGGPLIKDSFDSLCLMNANQIGNMIAKYLKLAGYQDIEIEDDYKILKQNGSLLEISFKSGQHRENEHHIGEIEEYVIIIDNGGDMIMIFANNGFDREISFEEFINFYKLFPESNADVSVNKEKDDENYENDEDYED